MKIHLVADISRESRLKRCLFSVASLLVIIALTATPVKAYDFAGVIVHVTAISPVGMPGDVEFTSDNTPSACNGFLFYFPSGSDEATQQANAKAVMAIVLTAQLTGRSLVIYGINPTSSFQYCTVQWIALNNS